MASCKQIEARLKREITAHHKAQQQFDRAAARMARLSTFGRPGRRGRGRTFSQREKKAEAAFAQELANVRTRLRKLVEIERLAARCRRR